MVYFFHNKTMALRRYYALSAITLIIYCDEKKVSNELKLIHKQLWTELG